MAIHAYLFETRSIQSFLFSSGKLKDLVGGSDLLDYLCRAPLSQALKACDLSGYETKEKNKSPRCAGGTFYLIFDDKDDQHILEKAQRFRQIWPLLVAEMIPGIEQVDAFITNKNSVREAIKAGLDHLKIARNQISPTLPIASPITERAPKTGFAAVKTEKKESIDEATKVKRAFKADEEYNLTSRFCDSKDIKWPVTFERGGGNQFPMSGKAGELVALIHADGNGLGEVLRTIIAAASELQDKEYIQLYHQFSDGFEKATIEACQQATHKTLLRHVGGDGIMPARPLVLGGDDLTAIVAAKYAFEFTEHFIQAFEEKTSLFLADLKTKLNSVHQQEQAKELPEKLTACAGIVFMKPSQPFAMCYQLAEALCGRAKKQSRAIKQGKIIPSSLAFHRLQSTLIANEDVLFNLEMKVKNNPHFYLGLPVYGIEDASSDKTTVDLPKLGDLNKLAKLFTSEENKLNEKRLRSLLTLMHLDPILAKKDYRRFRELTQERGLQAQLNAFDEQLATLLGVCVNQLESDLPCAKKEQNQYTVLADLLTYLAIEE